MGALPRAKRRTQSRRRAKPGNRPRRSTPRASGRTEARTAAWYEGKSFSADWTSWHFPNWMKLLAPYRRRKLRVLEIGSWEGRSALFFLNYLPQATLTCIDTFAGGQEHREAAASNPEHARILKSVEGTFDRNTAAFRPRIEKIKATSTDALIGLGLQNRRFNVAYVDGGHRASEVYADAMLTWPLMVPGGLMIFDDYQWREMPQPLDNPGPGIDAFLKAVEGQYRLVLDDYQIAVARV